MGIILLLQVGCGAGNTVYPLLEVNPELRVYACDFSPKAVQLVQAHPGYSSGMTVHGGVEMAELWLVSTQHL
jgi:2-polyprenyl-3-methyl-5-hydroxy-6-metoxy-1,4-benzoquinol methylase